MIAIVSTLVAGLFSLFGIWLKWRLEQRNKPSSTTTSSDSTEKSLETAEQSTTIGRARLPKKEEKRIKWNLLNGVIIFLILAIAFVFYITETWKEKIFAFLIGVLLVFFFNLIAPRRILHLIKILHTDFSDVYNKKWAFRFLKIEVLLFALFFISISHESNIRNSSFGPPVVFSARKTDISIPRPDSKNSKSASLKRDGYRIISEKFGKNPSSHDGFLIPNRQTGNIKRIVANSPSSFGGQDPKSITVPEIAKLEFKKPFEDSSRAIWALETIDSLSLIPHAALYTIDTSEFEIYLKHQSLDSLIKKLPWEITNIRIHNAVRLNGIEVTGQKNYRTIWLLGYDGKLYSYDVEKQDPILNKGKLLATPEPVDLTEVWNLTEDVSFKNLPETGWQSLDIIETPNSEELLFLATNAKTAQLVLFKIQTKTQYGHPKFSIMDTCSIPNNAKNSWDEGSAATQSVFDNTKGSHYLCVTNALEGLVTLGLEWKTGLVINGDTLHFGSKTQKPKTLEIKTVLNVRSYIEGVAFGQSKHSSIVVSDRDGRIYFRPCFHIDLDIASSPICHLRRIIPARIQNLLKNESGDWWATIDMRGSIVHGQDIAIDSDGDVWVAEENYFRRLSKNLFSPLYQWDLLIKRNSQEIITILLTFVVITVGVSRRTPKRTESDSTD